MFTPTPPAPISIDSKNFIPIIAIVFNITALMGIMSEMVFRSTPVLWFNESKVLIFGTFNRWTFLFERNALTIVIHHISIVADAHRTATHRLAVRHVAMLIRTTEVIGARRTTIGEIRMFWALVGLTFVLFDAKTFRMVPVANISVDTRTSFDT